MWTTGTNGRVTVTLEKNGEQIAKEFDGNILVRDAVISVAKDNGIKNFVVEDNSNNEISESQGTQPLSSVGNLTVLPETVGAAEEVEVEVSEDETVETAEEPAKEEEAKTSDDE